MGSTDLQYGVLERKIKSIYIHPEYKNKKYEFDVAIIEVDEIIFTDHVQQVCLPYLPMDEEEYKENDRITISGHYNLESCNASETIASLEISSHKVRITGIYISTIITRILTKAPQSQSQNSV